LRCEQAQFWVACDVATGGLVTVRRIYFPLFFFKIWKA
jgi:hypothetical protein